MVNRAELGELSVSRYSDDDLRRIAEACGHMNDRDLGPLRDALDRALLRCEIARVPEKTPSDSQMKKAAEDIHAITLRLGKKFEALEDVLTFVVINRLGSPWNIGHMADAIKDLQKFSKAMLDAAVCSATGTNSNSEPGQSSSLELLVGKDLPEMYQKFSGLKFRIKKFVDGTVGGSGIIFIQA